MANSQAQQYRKGAATGGRGPGKHQRRGVKVDPSIASSDSNLRVYRKKDVDLVFVAPSKPTAAPAPASVEAHDADNEAGTQASPTDITSAAASPKADLSPPTSTSTSAQTTLAQRIRLQQKKIRRKQQGKPDLQGTIDASKTVCVPAHAIIAITHTAFDSKCFLWWR